MRKRPLRKEERDDFNLNESDEENFIKENVVTKKQRTEKNDDKEGKRGVRLRKRRIAPQQLDSSLCQTGGEAVSLERYFKLNFEAVYFFISG